MSIPSSVAGLQTPPLEPPTRELTAPPCVAFQLLDGRAGERNLFAASAALLGPQPPRQQEQQGPAQGLPRPPDRQLPVAALQPHLPHHPGPVHGPGDERHSVPHAHGLRRAEDGPAAGHGPQQATGHAEQRQLKGHTHTYAPTHTHIHTQYFQAKSKRGLAGLPGQSPMPDTSKHTSSQAVLPVVASSRTSCFTLQPSQTQRLGLSPQSFSSQTVTSTGARRAHNKAFHLYFLCFVREKA